MELSIVVFLSNFNSRPSARGDHTGSLKAIAYISFQFTPLREGRPDYIASVSGTVYFNSRPSARGDRWLYTQPSFSRHFNSRPSARGDWRNGNTYCRFGISIHAPPRGATDGADACNPFQNHFNSRPSARGDSGQGGKQRVLPHISIHAPPRGATNGISPQVEHLRNFNSRPSARGDSKRYAISANLLFNPYKSAWLNNNATQFVEIILVIFHRIIA